MASKRAKQKQTLEKAKQLVLKNKKGKAKAKPKQSYPEGQNAPQSKAYTIENDKTQPAKRTGWRFTKEGAKRLKKDINATPSQADVDKYRNQTFKVKGNVNKSGPKGTSDGSHRYIYIERRADKSDLKRTQKLAHGGIVKDIEQKKKQLIAKAKTKGIYENFGQKEVQELQDKYGHYTKEIAEFDNWAMNFDTNDLKEYAKGGSIQDKRERVIDYYLNNDVFDDPYTYDLSDEDLKDAKKSKSYKKIEDAIVKYHGLDDDENVQERFEVLGLEDEDYAKGGKTKDPLATYLVTWTNYYKAEAVIEANSEQESIEIAMYGNPNVEQTFLESDYYSSEIIDFAKGGKVREFEINDEETGKTLIFKARSLEEAEGISSTIDFNDYEDGDIVDVLEEMDSYNEMDEYAKGGKTKNLPTDKDVREFQEYVFSFYGKDGLHADAFDGGATTEEILLATNQYLTFCARNTDLWGGGDTADREYVRDIMLYHRGVDIDDLFYSNLIKKIKKTTILEYGGILQPMIGGVNADPRFDIYNTTMFAEDGAMLELGGENPDEKLKVEIRVIVHEDDYEKGEGKLVNTDIIDWLKTPIVRADDLLDFLGKELGLSNDPNDYVIDDDGVIHTSRLEDAYGGSEASESQIEKWKKGEIKLYSAQYSIFVEAVGQTRIPTQSELHVVTDIPTYEDGGDTDEYAKGGEFTIGVDSSNVLNKQYFVYNSKTGKRKYFASKNEAKDYLKQIKN